MHFFPMFVAVTLSVPPAVKVVAVSVSVYGVMQALKKVSFLQPYLCGWVAVLFNVILCALGIITTTPAPNLYTWATALAIIQSCIGAAGIHGTASKLTSEAKGSGTLPSAT